MESSNATSACSVVGENDNDHGFIEILRPKTLASPSAQSGEAIPTAHLLSRIVAASDSRPSGQGSTGLPDETHFQDEKTILDDQRPARGANSDGSFHEASARSGDADGLASGMEAAVNDAKATEGNSQRGNASGNDALPDMEEMVFPDNVGNRRIMANVQGGGNSEQVDDALSAQLRDLGRAANLAATLSAEHSVEQVLSTQYQAQAIATTAAYEKSKFKKSRIRKGWLIKRLTGYSIAETEYGVSYLWVLSRKPDRTSADNSVHALAGYFNWKSLEQSGLLKKEKKSK